jgi:hypothetical protein
MMGSIKVGLSLNLIIIRFFLKRHTESGEEADTIRKKQKQKKKRKKKKKKHSKMGKSQKRKIPRIRKNPKTPHPPSTHLACDVPRESSARDDEPPPPRDCAAPSPIRSSARSWSCCLTARLLLFGRLGSPVPSSVSGAPHSVQNFFVDAMRSPQASQLIITICVFNVSVGWRALVWEGAGTCTLFFRCFKLEQCLFFFFFFFFFFFCV